ncbi:MAG: GNAT family N-acetyltransferase [Streptosporangiales bacterium]|nr:GNAT family N-acetyltransferase [Streptosporangiales bacterium]
MTVAVRAARADDIDAAAEVLARAFSGEPLLRWIYRDQRTRPRRLRAMYVIMLHVHLGHGMSAVTEDDGRVSAVAMWDPPGAWQVPVRTQLRHLPSIMAMYGTELGALRRSLIAMGVLDGRHPAEPHYYLSYLGTDPGRQGGGRGGALLRAGLRRCDAEGAPAYLETSTPGNVGYYERFGFRIADEFLIPGGGPACWGMWRAPALQ